jgi:hypothetical protein
MEATLKGTAAVVTSLGIIFTALVTVETRYAKAADFDKLIRSQEQKIIWDLEENVDTSETTEDKWKWYYRLREKVADFCITWPDEDECKDGYLDEVEDSIE